MDHPYRWVIVAAGGLLGCVAAGAMFSLPVFLRPMAQDTGWSVTGISTAMTIGFLAMAAASMAWGNLSDRFGPRPVVLTGSIGLAESLALASRADSLVEFQLLFGLLVGAATAAVFAPMMACVTGWFDTQRGLAVSLVSAGMGMAPAWRVDRVRDRWKGPPMKTLIAPGERRPRPPNRIALAIMSSVLVAASSTHVGAASAEDQCQEWDTAVTTTPAPPQSAATMRALILLMRTVPPAADVVVIGDSLAAAISAPLVQVAGPHEVVRIER